MAANRSASDRTRWAVTRARAAPSGWTTWPAMSGSGCAPPRIHASPSSGEEGGSRRRSAARAPTARPWSAPGASPWSACACAPRPRRTGRTARFAGVGKTCPQPLPMWARKDPPPQAAGVARRLKWTSPSTGERPMPPLPSRLLFPLCLGACLGLFLACQGEAPIRETPAWATRSFATEGTPGWPTQGRLLHGSELESVSFQRAVFDGTEQPIQDLHLDKGELVGEVDYASDVGSPVVTACLAMPTVGATRNCGFVWKGVGKCAPHAPVHLGAGGCGLGTCSGDPVVRVCADTQSCVYANAIA